MSEGYCLRRVRALTLCALTFTLSTWTSSVSAQSYGLDSRAAIGAFVNNHLPSAASAPSGDWTVVNAFPNLTFQDPTLLTFEPGGNRLIVCSREGYIWAFANASSTTTKTLFLDLSAKTQGWDDCGLLGIAFHPQYGQAGSPNRGYVYVWYQYQVPGNIQGSSTVRPPENTVSCNRLSRFTVPDGSSVVDPNSELVLINLLDRDLWHNGGGIFFGSDGFLYLSDGDEGGADDQFNNTQILNRSLFSGVLRIDVDQDSSRSHPIRRHPRDVISPPNGLPGSSTANYYIPNDNPWLDANGGILEEFWAIGLRSPHRMTYDPTTGRIWLGDVGQDRYEEVNLITKGGNYQWGYMEGPLTAAKSKPSPLTGADTPPVYTYPHDQGNGCVIGGYVYRGSRFSSELGGKYIFGDNSSGRIWTLTYNGSGPATVADLVRMPPGMNYAGGLSSFGLDQNNELYMCTMGPNGQVWKLDRTGSTSLPVPALLSQTGVFADLASLSPTAGVIPYDVNAPLWSDAAAKRRWIAVPNDGAPYGTSEQITFSSTGEWSFPNGTVFVKHFELATNDTNPSLRKRLETRLLVRDNNGGVYGVTYKWRADNSDADLLSGSLTENITIATASGTRVQTWYYPSSQDCLTCHNPNANYVLGVKARQQNGSFTYPSTGRADNQLRTWNHLGMFSPALNEADIPGYPQLINISNATASLEVRSRSYIDANCAQCHRPNGASAYFDARFDTPLANQGLVDGNVINNLGIANARVVAPADLSRSVLYQRVNTTVANIKMPPLAHNVIDAAAVAVLGDWINSLPPSQPQPGDWQDLDIGNVGLAGDVNINEGVFTIDASGADIWDTADAFHFVFQPMSGDGQIIARVVNVSATDGWAKAGVMIRETLAANSSHALMVIANNQGASFERRVTTGGTSTDNTIGNGTIVPPYWVKLVRNGNTFTGYASSDGVNWTSVGSDNISMAANVYVGLAVTAHNNSTLNTSTLDNVEVLNLPYITTQPQSQTVSAGSSVNFNVEAIGAAPLSYQWRFNGAAIPNATGSSYTLANAQTNNSGNYSVVVSNPAGTVTSANATLTVIGNVSSSLPSPWVDQDIGNVGFTGSATANNGVFTIRASGDDIWNTADAFHFVYQPLTGDGQIIARVVGVQDTDGWAKAGVMIRETLTPGSRHALMVIANNQGASFERRNTTGGLSTDNTAGYGTIFPPYWAKLVRSGNTLTGYASSDGSNWTLVGSDTVSMATTVFIGLAVTAHDNAAINLSTLDNVSVIGNNSSSLPAPWLDQDIGSVGLPGNASGTNGLFTIRASGDDIWNTADAFHFVFQPLNGDGQISARVLSVEDTDGWAKAGVMIRETLAPNSRHAFMLIANNQGSSFAWRINTADTTSSTNFGFGTIVAPYWVRLTRSGNTFTGYRSSDGANWTSMGSVTIPMTANTYVGLAVTAHNNSALNTSTLDNVGVTPGATQGGPARLLSPWHSNNVFRMILSATPNSRYEIQTSTNLRAWTVLTILTNNATGQIQFLDTNNTDSGFRFYRAHFVP